MSRLHGRLWTMICGPALLLILASSGAVGQDPLENAPLAPESMPNKGASAKGPTDSPNKTDANAKSKSNAKPEFIVKTPAEWRRILTKVQFAVTREKHTEPAFTGKYASGHFRGTFVCACCDAAHVESELFSAQTKFESGTGWPSFYQAFNARAVQTAWDYGAFEPRLEVMCRRCGAHLGHVFDDGPPPTSLRFCINSAAIKLISPEGEASSKRAPSKASTKSKAKAKLKTGAKTAPKGTPPSESTAPAAPEATAARDKTG